MPLLGWLVGGAGAGVFVLLQRTAAPKSLTLGIALGASLVISRGLHERGFASLCDAFGGGWTREQVMRILGDARVGSYGVVGLVLLMLLEYRLLLNLSEQFLPWMIIAGHCLGRWSISLTMGAMEPAETPAPERPSRGDLLLAFAFVLPPLLVVGVHYPLLLTAIPLVLLISRAARKPMHAKTGGYVRAGLSTTFVTTRVAVYMLALIALKFPSPDGMFWKFF